MAEAWTKKGICYRSGNTELWDKFFAETALERREARNLCFQCPVRRECLTWALDRMEIWGVWGGCDESEIRRALWVDANGDPRERCRYPHCPYCKARPSRLVVVSRCEVRSGRKVEHVECVKCGLTWSGGWSVQAVKAYWRQRARDRQLRAKVPLGRVPSSRRKRGLSVVPMAEPAPVPQTAGERLPALPLVASGSVQRSDGR